jgi:acyl carrier protein
MMNLPQQVSEIISNTLQIDQSARTLDQETALIGAIPEFDSMAVVSIITALEERFGFAVDDDEIDASIFETVGTLVTFVEGKLQAG